MYPESWPIPKYSKRDAPNWSPGKGHSFIDFSGLKLKSYCSSNSFFSIVSSDFQLCSNTSLDILLFEEPTEFNWKDLWSLSGFCCTDQLVESGACSEAGTLIVPSKLVNAVHESKFVSSSSVTTSFVPQDIIYHHDIEKSGMYVLLMVVCDSTSNTGVVLNGKIDSVDPYGYLPADEFANLPFYELLSASYSLLAVIWILICYFNREELIVVQHWISAVLAFGLLETCVEYGYYLDWNDKGTKHVGIAILATVFGTCKRSLSRILVQLVALGYGIVRPTLGSDLHRVLFLGLTYFVLSLIYTLATEFPSNSTPIDDPEYNMISLVILMLAGVDTTFYIWIITSINNLLITLAARKLVMKYLLYRNFRYVLFISLFCTLVWVVYGSMLTFNDGYGEENYWRYIWTIDALWELTYFALFFAICILWSPHKNSHRFAYSYELVNMTDDDEWHNLNNDETTNEASESTDAEENSRPKKLKKKYLLEDDSDDESNQKVEKDDPFQGTGALDPNMAILKKN